VGPWYAFWHISAYGCLIQLHSTGILITWMLSSSGMEATYFLNFIKAQSPEIVPAIIMTNCNKAQTNAIAAVYPDSKVLLCWWHMLHTIQMHFHMNTFSELWEHIHAWVKTSDQNKFDSLWQEIQTNTSVP
jgi:hypothetical protein